MHPQHSRTRQADALDEARASRRITGVLPPALQDLAPGSVVSIVAPPGYGKTSVLKHLARTRRVVLLRVTSLPQNSAALVDSLVRQLRDALAPEAPRVDQVRDLREALAPATSWLTRTGAIVAFDDVHLADTDELAAGLGALIAAIPRTTPIVLTARHDTPALSADAWPGRSMRSIGPADLRLGPRQVSMILGDGAQASARSIVSACDGWPAAIWAAQRENELPSRRSGQIEALTDALAAYVEEEIIDPLPHNVARALELAALTHPAPLVIASASASVNLDAARRYLVAHPVPMVTVPGDADAPIRVAELMRAILLSRLQRVGPGRAAPWFDSLVRSLCDAGYEERAFQLVNRYSDREALVRFTVERAPFMMFRGRYDTVNSWLDTFDGQELLHHSELLLIHVLKAMLDGQLAALRYYIARQSPGSPAIRYQDRDALAMFKEMTYDQKLGEATLRMLDTGGPALAAMAGLFQAMTAVNQGSAKTGIAILEAMHDLEQYPWLHLIQTMCLAWGYFFDDAPQFREVLQRANALLAQQPGLAHQTLLANLYGMNAVAAAVSGDGVQAQAQVALAEQLLGLQFHPGLRLMTHYLLMRTQLLLGDQARVLHHLDAGRREAGEVPEVFGLVRRVEELAVTVASARTTPARQETPEGKQGFTSAELRVLGLLNSPYSAPTIARELGIAPATVRTHCRALFKKLGVHDRASAVDAARRDDLL